MGVHIHPDRQTAMVNDNGRFLKSIREVGEIGQLVMEHPGVEAEPARRQMTKARPKAGVKKQATWWPARHIAVWSFARVIVRRLPDTAKAVRRKLHCAIEIGSDVVSEPQIPVTDDPGTDATITENTARTHCTDTVGKLNLAQWAHHFRAVLARERVGLDVNRRDDPVTGSNIVQIIVEQVSDALAHKQVMARIHDWNLRFQDWLVAAEM